MIRVRAYALQMIATTLCCGLAIIVSTATAQDLQNADGTLTSGGKLVPLQLLEDVIAIVGERGIAVRSNGEFQPGIADYVEEMPQLAELAEEGVFFVRPTENWKAVDTVVRQTGRVQQTGMAAKIPRAEVPEEDWPVVVVTNEFVVRFSDETGQQQADALAGEFGARVKRTVPYVDDQYVMELVEGTPRETLDVVQRFRALNGVEFAEPNLIRHHVTRNDPLFGHQWHLDNTGQGNGVAGADVDAQGAWMITRGDLEILVAVIDPDGVQLRHEDLQPNRFFNPGETGTDAQGVPKNANGVDDDDNGYIDDFSGWSFRDGTNNPEMNRPHGTAAAGVAVAADNNNLGVSGLAPHCRLLGLTTGTTDQDDADALYYAAAMGADVISCSWGYSVGVPATELVEQAIEDIAHPDDDCLGRQGLGCVVVFAMTNENIDNFGGPNGVIDISSLPDVIAVGRSTNTDRWGLSGFGEGMELLAPTQAAKGTTVSGCTPNNLAGTLDITTTDLMGNFGYNSGAQIKCFCNSQADEIANFPNYTSCFGGTSSATPLVAGAAALVLSIHRSADAAEVRNILTTTAVKIEPAVANYTAIGNGQTYSTTHGFGRLNAAAAVQEADRRAQVAQRNVNSNKHRLVGPDRDLAKRRPGTQPAGAALLTQASPSLAAEAPTTPGQAADPESPDRPKVMIEGQPAIQSTVPYRGKRADVYALENQLAICFKGEEVPREVQELQKRGLERVDTEWSRDLLQDRGCLIVHLPANRREEFYPALMQMRQAGIVESLGQVVAFDDRGSSYYVMLDHMAVHLNSEHDASLKLQRFTEQEGLGLEESRRPKSVPNREDFVVTPGASSVSPLELVHVLEASGSVDQVRPTWVAAIRKRQR